MTLTVGTAESGHTDLNLDFPVGRDGDFRFFLTISRGLPLRLHRPSSYLTSANVSYPAVHSFHCEAGRTDIQSTSRGGKQNSQRGDRVHHGTRRRFGISSAQT